MIIRALPEFRVEDGNSRLNVYEDPDHGLRFQTKQTFIDGYGNPKEVQTSAVLTYADLRELQTVIDEHLQYWDTDED